MKNLKLGLGEYENIDQSGERLSRQELRCLFLSEAAKANPKLAEDLDELLSLYSQIPLLCYSADKKRRNSRSGKRYAWSKNCRPKWGYLEQEWTKHIVQQQGRPTVARFEVNFDNYYDVQNRQGIWLTAVNMPPHRDPRIEEFITKLFNWSSKYRLDALWCREFAYETLDLWSQSSVYKTAGIWWYTPALVSPSRGHGRGGEVVMLMRQFQPCPQEFVFRRFTLFPVQGFRAGVKQSITNEFNMQLDAFLDRCEEQAKDAKLVRSIRKDTDKHVKWLAEFQINEWEYSQISNERAKAKKAMSSLRGDYSSDHNKKVRQAINKLAQLIDLPLRQEPRRPGRRGKLKTEDS